MTLSESEQTSGELFLVQRINSQPPDSSPQDFCFVSCDFALWTSVIFSTLIFLRHLFIIAFQAINSDRSGGITSKLELSLQDV